VTNDHEKGYCEKENAKESGDAQEQANRWPRSRLGDRRRAFAPGACRIPGYYDRF
jgi:hypothetical protein